MLENIENLFKVFADKNRIRIIKLLEQRKLCVCEIADVLQVTQPSVSRHLKKMKKAGLVKDEQDGFWTNYFLKTESRQGKTLIGYMAKWVAGDKVIQSDLKRLKAVDRKKLCCR